MFDQREVRKYYANIEVVAKLQRLTEALEHAIPVEIQIAGEGIRVPPHADITFHYEQSGEEEGVGIEIKWKRM